MYVVLDGDIAAVVDTGLAGRAAWSERQAGLQNASVGQIRTALITHSHPDHYGNAARLAGEPHPFQPNSR